MGAKFGQPGEGVIRITVLAAGRLRAGPEHALFTDYRQRFDLLARPLGFHPLALTEIEERSGSLVENETFLKKIPDGSVLACCDERGDQLTSEDFAGWLAHLRDQGSSDLTLAIGGADGISEPMRQRSSKLISFGKMVWPHLLARVMLSEQLYRALSILAGKPYHRN